jgi:hypothetical protein
MKIQIYTDKISQLTTLTLSGEMDFNKLLSSIETVHTKSEHTEHTRNYLWDFKSVIGGESLSVLQMGKFYGLCNIHFYAQDTKKIALLVGDEMGFGFNHIMAMFEEQHEVYQNVRVFKSTQSAKDWFDKGFV